MNKQEVQELVTKGKLTDALRLFIRLADVANDSELKNTSILLSARLNNVEKDNRMGVITADDYQRQRNQITHAILGSLEDIPDGTEVKPEFPKVFISYRHADEQAVKKIKTDLEAAGIEALIDFEKLDAGEDIQKFIVRMIKEADATLSVVSDNSLSSPWVGLESDMSLNYDVFSDKTKFIACSLDSEFFKEGFVSAKIKELLEKITGFQHDLEERKKLLGPTTDTSDLDGEINRHKEFANNLSKIVNRLKENLTVDISGDNYEQGMAVIIRTVKG